MTDKNFAVNLSPDKTIPKWKARTNKVVKADIGEIVDARVSDWHSIGPGTGTGFAFILPECERRGSLYIRESDVISQGTISVDTFIRCEVASPAPGFNKNIEGNNSEIYEEKK